MLAELNEFNFREQLFELRCAARPVCPRNSRSTSNTRASGCAYSSSAHAYRLFRLLKKAAARPARTQGLLLREMRGAEKGDYRAVQKSCQVDEHASALRAPRSESNRLKSKEISPRAGAPRQR